MMDWKTILLGPGKISGFKLLGCISYKIVWPIYMYFVIQPQLWVSLFTSSEVVDSRCLPPKASGTMRDIYIHA